MTTAAPIELQSFAAQKRETKPLQADRLERAIEWILYALLVFMPLAYGAVDAWSEMTFVVVAWVLAILMMLRLILRPQGSLAFTWMYLPVVLFLGVAALQLVPLPPAIARLLSPEAYRAREQVFADLPAASRPPGSFPLSLYPHGTVHDLRLVLAFAAIFIVVVNVFQRSSQIKRLLTIIVVAGSLEAVISLTQYLTGTDRIYWTVPMVHPDSGTFANHSHYGQFINLSVGAALALLLIRLRELSHDRKLRAEKLLRPLSDWAVARIWLLGAIILLFVGTLCLSLTRGGMAAALIAGVLSAVPVTRQLGGRGWGKLVLFLCVMSLLFATSFNQVFNRLETIQTSTGTDLTEGRGQIVLDVVKAFPRFPWLGTGLGTFDVVYPAFQHLMTADLVEHADNDYAQLLFETGSIGLGLSVIFLVGVGTLYLKCLGPNRPSILAAAPGIGFGLLAILIQSGSDFGQHLPAIGSITAIFCGLLVVLCDRNGRTAHRSDSKPDRAVDSGSWKRRSLLSGTLVLMSFVAGWAVLGANSARAAESHWWRAVALESVVRQQNWDGSNDQYAVLISEASAAAEAEPDNIRYAHWANVYRWEAIARIRDPHSGDVARNSLTAATAGRVVTALHSIRSLAPTFGPTLSVAGQLERSMLNRGADGDRHIHDAMELGPYDPCICFAAASVAAADGDWNQAGKLWNRSIMLDPGQIPSIVRQYTDIYDQPNRLMDITGNDRECTAKVLRSLPDPLVDPSVLPVQQHLIAFLKDQCGGPDAPPICLEALASASIQDGDYAGAADEYRQLLDADQTSVNYHMGLARSLSKLGHVQEAIDQTRFCLRLQPEFADAKRLLGDLSILPRTEE